MQKKPLAESELVLNKDGSIYHLSAFPEDIADIVLTVGDPERVSLVSNYFDKIEIKRQHREFVTHTGWLGNKRMTVVSTGIGVDNVDIVLSELDALVNVDFKTRLLCEKPRQLNIIRMGTCGGLHAEYAVDTIVLAQAALGFDNLMNFYAYQQTAEEQALEQAINQHLTDTPVQPYAFFSDPALLSCLAGDSFPKGITATCSGFYGPQCRTIRAELSAPGLLDDLRQFQHKDMKILTFEMETSAILGFGKLLQHRCCAASVIVANRALKKFTSDSHQSVDKMIRIMLERLEKF